MEYETPKVNAWDWALRVALAVILAYNAYLTRSLAIVTEKAQANHVQIERINASRYTPEDALEKERSDNKRWETISSRMSQMEGDIRLILSELQKGRRGE